MRNKILITGGHLTPAISMAETLLNNDFQVYWAGAKFNQTSSEQLSPEFNLVTKRNIPFYELTTGKLWRKWTKATFSKGVSNLLKIPYGLTNAISIINKVKPDLILSFGGYIALPIVIAAKLHKIPVITHEQTLIAGLANKVITKFADKILVAWQETSKYFPSTKVIFTGNPIRKELLDKPTTKNFNFKNNLPIVYVTGGNQGSNTINKRILERLDVLLPNCNIIHQTGNSTITKDYDAALTAKQLLNTELKDRYIVKDVIFGPEIAEVFSKADLFVCRSGANTVSEILTFCKLAILIPIPWASHQEQLVNAKYLESKGIAKIIEQSDDMPARVISDAILSALDNINKQEAFDNVPLAKKKEDLAEFTQLDANEKILAVVKKYLGKTR